MKKIKVLLVLMVTFFGITNSSYAWGIFWKKTTPIPCPEGQKPPCNETVWCLFCETPGNSKVSLDLDPARVEKGKDGTMMFVANVNLKNSSKEGLAQLKNSGNTQKIEGGAILTLEECKKMGISERYAGASLQGGTIVSQTADRRGWPTVTVTITFTIRSGK